MFKMGEGCQKSIITNGNLEGVDYQSSIMKQNEK